MKKFSAVEDQYQIEGVDLVQLAGKYGTPLYVYDAGKMAAQYKAMKKAFSAVENLKINYACKANTNLNVLKLFQKLGSGLDTVSIQEVEIGLRAGFALQDILYTPNGVSLIEIKKAVDLGVRINIDNLSILEQLGHDHPGYPVGIRINPHIMAGGNVKISVGHIDSKFGISYYQLPHIKRIIENTGLKIEGIHMHTGSDILDVEVFLQGAEILLEVAGSFPNLDYVNFGSGFKVPYREEDIQTDVGLLGQALTERFHAFCKAYGKSLCLMFEPGKFLVSLAGYFLASVNVIKHTTSTVFAGVDSGFNHLIRPMFYDAYHQIDNISNSAGRMRFYTVVGYICESDTFGLNRKISEIREGDVLCFKNAGAYCFSMASNYNSRYRPAEVMVYQAKGYLIRKRETLQDLLRQIVEIEW
ncbi:MAG: diaminopimelate decarboxylase [Flavobacteriales bacterium AspAUS03]